MALARLSQLKSDLLLNESASTYDDALKALLTAASTFANKYCHRILESATYTDERYTGDGTKYLYPEQYPVTTFTSAKIWDGTTETYVAETASYFEVLDQRKIKYPKLESESDSEYTYWPTTADGIKLTYVAGYSTTSWDTAAITASFGVPADLEYAVAYLAALWWMESKQSAGRLGITGINVGAESLVIERYEKGVPPVVAQTLNRYKKPGY
jgi:uncharacterized phiE125 gp8 family phage protein